MSKKNNKGKYKDVIYHILYECSMIVKDEFWKQFYEDLASGKTTKGIYITNGIVQTSNKRNGFVYSITDKAPEVIVTELHYLLTTHTSICSKKDMNKKKQFVQDIEDELNEYDQSKWTSIKRKNIRIMLLVDYAIHLNKLYGLSWPETMLAYKTIINSFDSKTHSSKDVVYENGKILNIEDIVVTKDKKKIINNRLSDKKIDNTIEDKTNCLLLQDLFEPYIIAWSKSNKI
jgi:hypothetical protein